MLGDLLPHGGHRLHFVIAEVEFFAGNGGFDQSRCLTCAAWRRRRWCSRTRRWCGGCRCGSRGAWRLGSGWRTDCAPIAHRCQDIVLAHAPASTGAGDLREVDIVFAGDATDKRGTANFFSRGRRRSGRRGCGWCRALRWSCRGRLWRFRLCRRRRGSRGRARRVDYRNDRLNRNRLARVDFDLFQNATGGCGNLRGGLQL